jgi:hypothetical protein
MDRMLLLLGFIDENQVTDNRRRDFASDHSRP